MHFRSRVEKVRGENELAEHIQNNFRSGSSLPYHWVARALRIRFILVLLDQLGRLPRTYESLRFRIPTVLQRPQEEARPHGVQPHNAVAGNSRWNHRHIRLLDVRLQGSNENERAWSKSYHLLVRVTYTALNCLPLQFYGHWFHILPWLQYVTFRYDGTVPVLELSQCKNDRSSGVLVLTLRWFAICVYLHILPELCSFFALRPCKYDRIHKGQKFAINLQEDAVKDFKQI